MTNWDLDAHAAGTVLWLSCQNRPLLTRPDDIACVSMEDPAARTRIEGTTLKAPMLASFFFLFLFLFVAISFPPSPVWSSDFT
jgi:hypothetical protein